MMEHDSPGGFAQRVAGIEPLRVVEVLTRAREPAVGRLADVLRQGA